MSEPSASPTPPDPGAAGGPLELWGQVLSAASEVLAGIAESLKVEPVLLAGFAAMFLVELAGVLYGGTFLLVASLMFGAYVLSLVALFVFRRWGSPRTGRAAGDRRRAKVRRSRRVQVSDFGAWRGDSRVDVRRSEDVVIGGSPAREPAPAVLPVPESEPAAESTGPEPFAPRKPYTPTLARTRDTVLNAARGGAGGAGVRFEVVADSGCGKTLLLEEIAAGLKEDRRLVLFITAGAPQYGEAGAMGAAGREMAEYAACRQIIDAIATDVHRAYVPEGGEAPLLDAAAGRELEASVLGTRDGRQRESRSAGNNVVIDVRRSREVSVGGIGEAVAGALAREPALSRLAEMQQQLTRVMDEAARSRPTALLVDDVHTVAGTPVENWLMAVLRGMSTAVVVHAGRPAGSSGERAPAPGAQRLRLGLLAHDETTAFVKERLVEAGWRQAEATAAAGEIAVLTRGHPIGVATCTTIVGDSLPADASTAEVRALLLGGAGHWDDDGAFDAVRTYVDDYAARIVGRPLPLFDLLVVLRRCTAPILAAVLGATEGVGERQASLIYDWLSRCAFVTPFDDDESEGWRLHDYLRENLDLRFRRTRPTQHAALHAAVERYYRTRLNFDEEREEQPIGAVGARYEDADWQRDSQEWLHHAAFLPREAYESSKRAMIRLFLEAFFWWDMEVSSSYCAQLVSAYRALPTERDLRWVDWLDQLRTGYVAGRANQAPGRDRERWEQAGAALDAVTSYLGLRRGHIPADPDLRRIYIISALLQGEAIWFAGSGGDSERNRAAAWFRAGGDACTDENELWIGNWAVHEEAGLWAASDPARARALLAGFEDRLAAQEDTELPVWLADTYADIAWAENDPRRCFDAHARAALHGFAYHVRQETYGQYPNHYTDSLYRSVLTHVERRERAALDAGLTDEVAAAKARSRALFAPYWEHIGRDPGDTFGLPDPPAATDLGSDLTPFARAAKWVVRNMEEELEKSVEEPLRDPAAP
ncbi:AAA family ATPase [Streptomyces sp. SID9124]|uniref:AAA family ATPase n=1 Tax=Streptomyces sp. SID9124 TaxID=2706108 RepID=UPI001EF186D5|nr:AAA family ATPase [Streptomyces sp. SID9124]